jgi:uncharacterized protein
VKLPASGYRRMPWKNGGGETFEIAVSPQGASLEDMDWRISMAVVASDGPFSSFPGIDRTLSIVDGAGLALQVGAAGNPQLLTQNTAPFHFPADVATSARLLGGTVTDLNVMTRRDRCRHVVYRVHVDGHYAMPTAAAEALVFCVSGSVQCHTQHHGTEALQVRDCAVFSSAPGRLEMVSPEGATVLIAELFRSP